MAAGDCLLASGRAAGVIIIAVVVVVSEAVAACLPLMGAAGGVGDGVAVGSGVGCLLAARGGGNGAGRLCYFFFSSHPSRPIGLGLGSSAHPIGKGGASFPFSPDPLPSAFLGLLTSGLFPRPRPGDVRAWGMACGGGLVACPPACFRVRFAYSAIARSLAAIRPVSLASLCLPGALCGVLRAISAAYLSALAFFNICP